MITVIISAMMADYLINKNVLSLHCGLLSPTNKDTRLSNQIKSNYDRIIFIFIFHQSKIVFSFFVCVCVSVCVCVCVCVCEREICIPVQTSWVVLNKAAFITQTPAGHLLLLDCKYELRLLAV